MDKEELFQFFAGTFNQDIYVDYPTWEAAVEDFKKHESKEELSKLASSIEEWMNGITNNAELEKALFYEMGCYIEPKTGDVRAFLQEIITELRK